MIYTVHNISRFNGLTFGNLNVCSIRNKIDLIKILLLDSDLDVLGVTETNLDENIPDGCLHIDRYTFIRQDNNNKSFIKRPFLVWAQGRCTGKGHVKTSIKLHKTDTVQWYNTVKKKDQK